MKAMRQCSRYRSAFPITKHALPQRHNTFRFCSDETVTSHENSSKLGPMKIAFIGGGRCATALIQGIINSGILHSQSQITVSDPYKSQLSCVEENVSDIAFENGISMNYCNSNIEAVSQHSAEVIFLSVKPQVMNSVLSELTNYWRIDKQLIVSIAAGITISQIEHHLPIKQRVIRMMPNTPALVCSMAAGITKGSYATNDDLSLICKLLRECGVIREVEYEHLLDTVTGLSGSGPAYVYMMIEALSDGGVKHGLDRATSIELAAQTVFGAAKMVLETGKHCGELKDQVTSPGGTTIAGVTALEQSNFRYSLINAVTAATLKAKELGQVQQDDMIKTHTKMQ